VRARRDREGQRRHAGERGRGIVASVDRQRRQLPDALGYQPEGHQRRGRRIGAREHQHRRRGAGGQLPQAVGVIGGRDGGRRAFGTKHQPRRGCGARLGAIRALRSPRRTAPRGPERRTAREVGGRLPPGSGRRGQRGRRVVVVSGVGLGLDRGRAWRIAEQARAFAFEPCAHQPDRVVGVVR
jgi:hypothetical protein